MSESVAELVWEHVESSNVRALAFQPLGSLAQSDGYSEPYGYLYVWFCSGVVYQYAAVTHGTYEKIRYAESIGHAVTALLHSRTVTKLGTL